MSQPIRKAAMEIVVAEDDFAVARFAREAGYAAACTLPSTFSRLPDPFRYPRVSVQRDDSFGEFRRKVSRTGRFLRTTPRMLA